MTDKVVCVSADLGVDALRALFLAKGISGVPVVDADGIPIGVVSQTDLVRLQHERDETLEAERLSGSERDETALEPGFHLEHVDETPVSRIMTPITFGVPEDASVAHASALMGFEGIHRLPVLSSDGHVVGIVSSLDVLRWLARQTGYVVAPSRRRIESQD
jgi:CBS domain-containing protein